MSTPSAQAIERDLAELWKEEKTAKDGAGVQRVYTTNLVAFAADHETGFRVEKTLTELVGQYPGRYILIRPAADRAEAPLRYYVSGHCLFWTEREKRVCCDIIKLVAQTEIIENLYGFTFSLLMPDLPVELWWPGDLPLTNVFFNRMAQECNRVWVDSSKFSRPEQSLARLDLFWKSHFPHTLLGDMNWIRTQRWRALIAELFDGEWAKYLSQVKEITIEYGEGTQATRSFFIACWIAAQLGWKYKSPRLKSFPTQIEWEGPSGKVRVVLKPVPVSDLKRDRIFGIGLITGGDQPAIFTVIRDQDPHCVVARSEINHKVAFSRVVAFEHLHSNQILGEGLKHHEADLAWEKTLEMAGSILERPLSHEEK
jgi:hypothetical protein